MSLAAFAVFLLPIALAVAGAALFSSPSIQAVGAVGGLAAGVAVARGVTRLLAPSRPGSHR